MSCSTVAITLCREFFISVVSSLILIALFEVLDDRDELFLEPPDLQEEGQRGIDRLACVQASYQDVPWGRVYYHLLPLPSGPQGPDFAGLWPTGWSEGHLGLGPMVGVLGPGSAQASGLWGVSLYVLSALMTWNLSSVSSASTSGSSLSSSSWDLGVIFLKKSVPLL